MATSNNPKSSLIRHGLAPSKKRGQNFLINQGTARRIVAIGDYSASEKIVEVGVGLGALTVELATRVDTVIGVEIDSGIIRYHETEKSLPHNVKLLHEDILRLDFSKLAERAGTPFKIIANLPYSISNPFIFKLIENRNYVSRVIVMLQKEVSDRLSAVPGTKAYGIPTILLGSFARVKKHMIVKPAEFHPRPKIDSEVIEIIFSKREIDFSTHHHQRIVRASFTNRRKTILNNLNNPSLFPFIPADHGESIKPSVLKILADCAIDPQIRAERLTIDQFESLTKAYEALILLFK